MYKTVAAMLQFSFCCNTKVTFIIITITITISNLKNKRIDLNVITLYNMLIIATLTYLFIMHEHKHIFILVGGKRLSRR